MFERFFLGHPRTVGESYGQHFLMALQFALAMLAGACVLLVHAMIPGLFVRSGSQIIEKLYDRMILNRSRVRQDTSSKSSLR